MTLRTLAAVGFVAAGVNHFVKPDLYRQIIPPHFPAPAMLVAISGVAEMVGGAGLLIRPLRRAAGWGLIALLIAVFPANIYMAIAPGRIPSLHIAQFWLWLRLPLQAIFIYWVWYVGIRTDPAVPSGPPSRSVRPLNTPDPPPLQSA